MLARLSIRAKITAVVALLLIPMMGMGLFSVWTMRTIHANAVDIQTNWLPSIRVLGNMRATTIDVRNLIRELMLSETAEQMATTRRDCKKSFCATPGFERAIKS